MDTHLVMSLWLFAGLCSTAACILGRAGSPRYWQLTDGDGPWRLLLGYTVSIALGPVFLIAWAHAAIDPWAWRASQLRFREERRGVRVIRYRWTSSSRYFASEQVIDRAFEGALEGRRA